jgi:hypothetical protein
MAAPILIELVIVEPILLTLQTAPVYSIGTAQAGPKGDKGDTGEKGEDGEQGPMWTIGEGDKSSATDAGNFGEVSLGDDYVYFCTQTGTAGNAVWKKTVLFNT